MGRIHQFGVQHESVGTIGPSIVADQKTMADGGLAPDSCANSNSVPQLSSFAWAGLRLLRDIEYRPMITGEDIEQLYRFRYECYRRKDYIKASESRLSHDKLDDDPNVMRFGIFHNGEMVSSIRLQLLNQLQRSGPSMTVYPDYVEPMIERGETMIDPSRFTVCEKASAEFPLLTYLTVRLAAVASMHFQTDWCLSSIRPSHGAFYKRVIESKMLAGERYYNGMSFPVFLYGSHVPTSQARVFSRYPFFHSLPHERRMLFDGWNKAAEKALTVLPTAEWALAA